MIKGTIALIQSSVGERIVVVSPSSYYTTSHSMFIQLKVVSDGIVDAADDTKQSNITASAIFRHIREDHNYAPYEQYSEKKKKNWSLKIVELTKGRR